MRQLSAGFLLCIAFISSSSLVRADEPNKASEAVPPAQSTDEARGRAKLLFELANGSLQVMHRDFFDDENMHAIPSASLEHVFKSLKQTYQVDMRWLNVGTDEVNVDHRPQNEFEKRAAESIKQGESYYEESSDRGYQFVGAVRLQNQCLKCHVKNRQTNNDRYAGLVITMPLRQPGK